MIAILHFDTGKNGGEINRVEIDSDKERVMTFLANGIRAISEISPEVALWAKTPLGSGDVNKYSAFIFQPPFDVEGSNKPQLQVEIYTQGAERPIIAEPFQDLLPQDNESNVLKVTTEIIQATLDNNVLPHQVLDILPAEEKLVFAEKVLSEIDQLESEYATALEKDGNNPEDRMFDQVNLSKYEGIKNSFIMVLEDNHNGGGKERM